MRYLLTLLIVSCFATVATAQNDLLLLRKNNKTIRQFYPGITIYFYNDNQQLISGYITSIKQDSLFMDQYDIRTFYTGWGSAVYDTISTYHMVYSYKDLVAFPTQRKLKSVAVPVLLQTGAAGYAALNIINAGTQNESLTGKENLRRLGIAAAVFATGFLLQKSKKEYLPIGKKYQLLYLRVQ